MVVSLSISSGMVFSQLIVFKLFFVLIEIEASQEIDDGLVRTVECLDNPAVVCTHSLSGEMEAVFRGRVGECRILIRELTMRAYVLARRS